MAFYADTGPLSLLEVVIYGTIGYGSVLLVMSLMVRDKFPEAPTQAIMRIVCVMPGMLCLVILAFHSTAIDNIVSPGDWTELVHMRVDDGEGTFGLPYPTVGILVESHQAGTVTVTYSNVTDYDRRSAYDVTDPTEVVRYSEGGIKYMQIENPVTWVIIHVVFVLLLFVWVIYQFATLFMIIGKQP